MSKRPNTVLYIFIDGIGIGKSDPQVNPFARYDNAFFSVLGGASSFGPPGELIETDVHMGVPGIPQSGTGQTALFTGYNGPAIFGRHAAGFPPFSLRPYLKEKSILRKFAQAGLRGSLINAYTQRFFEMLQKPRTERFMSASSLMQAGSGLPFLTVEDLKEGRAIYMDITNWYLRKSDKGVGLLPPKKAGRRMVDIARTYDLAVYEYFFPDRLGHDRSMGEARKVVKHMDGMLEGVWENIDPQEELVIVTSDHGNFEDLSIGVHTENPAPTILYGCGADFLRPRIRSLYDIPRAISELYGFAPENFLD